MADDWGNDPIQSMGMSETEAHATFDKVFGKGKWSLTGGFRTPEREAQLRAAGAGTVPPGQTSKHSEGTSNAPGAYDLVVSDMSPAQAAKMLKKSGVDFAKVLAEGAHGDEGAHLHVEAHPQFHDDWGNDPIVQPKPDAAKVPSKPGLLDQVGAAVKKDVRDIGHEYMEAGRAQKAIADRGFGAGKGNEGLGAGILEYGENALRAVTAPLTVMARNAAGEPVEKITGSKTAGKIAETAVDLGLPIAGELKAASEVSKLAKAEGVSTEAAKRILKERERMAPPKPANALKAATAESPEYEARVKRLDQKGVQLTPGQIKGGEAKIGEQQDTSSRYKGQAIREAHQDSIQTYNRGGYNDALKPIGEKYDPRGPVGRDGIDAVARKIGAVYDTVLPKARFVADQETAERTSEIKEANEELLGPYKGAFDAIVNQRVIARLDADHSMDGRTFKLVESELTGLANTYRQEGGGGKILANAIGDLTDVLRENMERHSPPGVRDELKKANTSWAMYKRLEAASERRPSSMGVFTPGDLQQAVKRGGRGGSFARGNALMQQYADDGQAVLGNIVPDSGTAGRQNRTRSGVVGAVIGDIVGGALGHNPVAQGIGAATGAAIDRHVGGVTNTLARQMLQRQSLKALGRAPQNAAPRNYLKAAEQRTRGPYIPVALPPPDQQP